MSHRVLLALVSVAILIGLGAVPVAAGEDGDVDGADFLVWRIWGPGQRALVVVKETSGGARLTGAIKGLEEGTEYRLIGTDEDGNCSTPVTTANRTFSLPVTGNTQANGTFFRGGVLVGADWKTTGSIRIREVGGADWACAASKRYQHRVAEADAAYATFASEGDSHGITLVERLTNGRARVSVALGDVNGDGTDDVSVRGSPKACGTPTGTVTFGLKLEDVMVSSFKSTTVDLTRAQLDGLRSIRVRKLTGDSGQDWFPDCRQSILLDEIPAS